MQKVYTNERPPRSFMHNALRAFTLIEVVVYLGLFAIIVGGAAVSAESLMESGARSTTESMLEEEGNFLAAKIDWALSGDERFLLPAANAPGARLSVSKWVPAAPGNPIDFFLSAGNLVITEGTAPPQALNSAAVSVSALVFAHASGGPYEPESVSASFTLSAKTPNGMTVSKAFSTVGYLKK